MPEIPDLEAIRGFLNRRIPGVRIQEARVLIPVVVRCPRAEFESTLAGDRFGEVTRRGKFLLFSLESGHLLVINPMLAGRFQYGPPSLPKRPKTCVVLTLADGHELRYADERLMGKIYLVRAEDLPSVPQFAEMGPDALEVSEEAFMAQLKRGTGQIKNLLTNHKVIAGIGNAYADEILFRARIHPFRKRRDLSDDDLRRLYRAMREVFDWAIPILAGLMKDELDYSEWRDHLKVHRRGGQPCPVCGTRISEVSPNQRVTSFCRVCQT